jgi:thioredoxin-related protein
MGKIDKIIMFTADFCQPCKQIKQYLSDFKYVDRLKIADAEEDWELIEEYKIRNVPTILILDSQDKILHKHIGYIAQTEFENICGQYETTND